MGCYERGLIPVPRKIKIFKRVIILAALFHSALTAYEIYPTMAVGITAPPGEVIVPDVNFEFGVRGEHRIALFAPEVQLECGRYNGSAAYAFNLNTNVVYPLLKDYLRIGVGAGISFNGIELRNNELKHDMSPSLNINTTLFKRVFLNYEMLVRPGTYTKARIGIRVY